MKCLQVKNKISGNDSRGNEVKVFSRNNIRTSSGGKATTSIKCLNVERIDGVF